MTPDQALSCLDRAVVIAHEVIYRSAPRELSKLWLRRREAWLAAGGG